MPTKGYAISWNHAMRHRTISIRTILLSLALLAAPAAAQEKLRSHLDLDWQAPNLWVHVDNVDAQKARLFENARKGWLAVLHKDDHLLGDGRALFWHARSTPAGETFFSFYPFRSWTDLEARREMIIQTQKITGDDAVKAYDSGDEALVSPHYSQIWRRAEDCDIVWPATQSLNELTAAVGRLEVRSVDIVQWTMFEQAWKRVTEALVACKYPLACRAFRSSYGKGEFMLWWLAPDSASYKGAPPFQTAVARQLGQKQSAEIFKVLEKVFPVEESYEVERRPDLCNLGK